MTWETAFALAVLLALVYGLIRHPSAMDVHFLGALMLFAVTGILTPEDAFAGFANEGMLTIGALFVVGAALVRTGLLGDVAHRLFGNTATPHGAVARMLLPIIGLSAFLNNTAVVAMALPVLLDWSRKRRIAASKLLLPLSYAAILGGVCTLIGTSTNLVIHGMMKDVGLEGFGMWELGMVGIPIALAGGLLLLTLAPRLLPDRKEFLEQLGETRREYLVEMLVQPSCPLIGRSIQAAGLRQLPGLFLAEIERHDQLITSVDPDERLQSGDRLVFTGVVSTIVDLQKIPGLVPAAEAHEALDLTSRRDLCEAVVSQSSPLVGQGIREAGFRTIYDAAVIAVHRNGQRLREKIGDIVLKPGDTLLLLTGSGFVRAHRNNPDFYLVSEVGAVDEERREKARLAAAITLAMVALMTIADLPAVLSAIGLDADWGRWLENNRVIFAFLAAGAMILTGCIRASEARRSVDWQVILVIAAAMGVGKAMHKSGAAEWIAGQIIHAADALGPHGILAAVYLSTWIATELMSNAAAAALMFPIALAAAHKADMEPRAFAVTVAIASSAGFLLPTGYQTHIMVFGPGGYRTFDFLRIGLLMTVLWFVLAMILIPAFWPIS